MVLKSLRQNQARAFVPALCTMPAFPFDSARSANVIHGSDIRDRKNRSFLQPGNSSLHCELPSRQLEGNLDSAISLVVCLKFPHLSVGAIFQPCDRCHLTRFVARDSRGRGRQDEQRENQSDQNTAHNSRAQNASLLSTL